MSGKRHRPGCRCAFCGHLKPESSGSLVPQTHKALTAEDLRGLLGEMDRRLAERGVSASVYLVGGAALALKHGRVQSTFDVDAAHVSAEVLEVAQEMSDELDLPREWFNTSASGWIPPRPPEPARSDETPGLHVQFAPAEHLLAMKLVASRSKDMPDIRNLIERLGLVGAKPHEFERVLRETYVGEGLLSTILGIPGDDEEATDTEVAAIARWASKIAASAT